MLGFFGYSPESEWLKWEKWEKKNGISENCYSIEYYGLNYYKIKGCTSSKYYNTFGDFSYFLDYKEGIFSELLHFYDSCKGYARYFTGDPACITTLRTYLQTEDQKILLNINFSEYLYDYKKIHAYTVASFSLSTLVMRIAAHNLFKMSKIFPYDVELLIIPPIKDYYSTPVEKHKLHCEEIEIFQVCPNCERLCDKLWGNYSVCADCHRTKICSNCGKVTKSGYFTSKNLPTCC